MMLHAVVECFLWLLGLCVGSFLNVVVYRLPAGLSIAHPPRSFCPNCQAGIAWYDNIPLLSWLMLGGRCRHCRRPISVQYPLVEGLTGLAFVLVYHLLFVVQSRADLGPTLLPGDLPLLFAWLVLVAGLVACSAMDIVSYSLDVRITNTVLLAAIGLHALWPRTEFLRPRAESATAAALLAAALASALMLWWTVWRRPAAEAEPEPAPQTAAEPDTAESRVEALAGRLAVLVFLAFSGWLVYAAARPGGLSTPAAPIVACLLAMFAAIVLIGGQRRPADAEIKAAIEEERPQARRMALRELLWLCPAIFAGVAVFVAAMTVPGVAQTWRAIVDWSPAAGFVPLAGAVVAIKGAIIGAMAGWVLRIVFTLALGREAFGTGDIYILAAAGAAGGSDIALLGLLFSVGVALAGWRWACCSRARP